MGIWSVQLLSTVFGHRAYRKFLREEQSFGILAREIARLQRGMPEMPRCYGHLGLRVAAPIARRSLRITDRNPGESARLRHVSPTACAA